MEFKSKETVFDGAVHAEQKVRISVTKEEAAELKQALRIIQRYEDLAIQNLDINPKDSEFCEVHFSVTDKVATVTLHDGMIG